MGGSPMSSVHEHYESVVFRSKRSPATSATSKRSSRPESRWWSAWAILCPTSSERRTSWVPRSVATKITGHRTESAYRRYAIVSDEDLRAAASRMAQRADTKTDTVARMPPLSPP